MRRKVDDATRCRRSSTAAACADASYSGVAGWSDVAVTCDARRWSRQQSTTRRPLRPRARSGGATERHVNCVDGLASEPPPLPPPRLRPHEGTRPRPGSAVGALPRRCSRDGTLRGVGAAGGHVRRARGRVASALAARQLSSARQACHSSHVAFKRSTDGGAAATQQVQEVWRHSRAAHSLCARCGAAQRTAAASQTVAQRATRERSGLASCARAARSSTFKPPSRVVSATALGWQQRGSAVL